MQTRDNCCILVVAQGEHLFIRSKKRGDRTYLQIVENYREGTKVKQRIRASLGRLDILQQSGQLDALLRSGLRFSQNLTVLDAHSKGECTTTHTHRIGFVILLEKLWKECSIGSVINSVLINRRFKYSVERVIFCTVLSRLINPGSDRGTLHWLKNYSIHGAEKIGLHHFYRTMGWLGKNLNQEKKKRAFGKNSVALCRKDLIEESLFSLRRDLFSEIELVFFDTTTLYFEGEGGSELGQRGNSKDHRPDLNQMVVGMVIDNNGNPVCSELLPGNTADVTTLIPVAKRLKERFGIERVCIVADRGMVSESTRSKLEELEWQYILGARLHRVKEIRESVLSSGGRYHEVHGSRDKLSDPAPLKVKEVFVNSNRYIICLNDDEARKERHARETIVETLAKKLKIGDKSLVGNKGFRRYIKSSGKRHFEIDKKKIANEKRFDGKYVLITNTDMKTSDVALKYKQLWMVESIFRTMKSTLDTRPIFHHSNDTIRGHVFCSFLALVIRKKLQDKLNERGFKFEWQHIVEDVDKIEEVAVVHNNQKFVIRTEVEGVAGKVLQAAGVALPPTLKNA